MESKLKYGVYSLTVLAIGIMMLISANTLLTADNIETIELLEDPVIIKESYGAGTSVQWHGTLDLYIKRAGTDEWVHVVHGKPNLITDIGANRTRGYLNGSITDGVTIANLSLSDDAGSPAAGWTELPAEITTNGLDRAVVATGLVNNGTGKFNITHTWTATASQNCQLIGTHWDGTDGSDGNLFSVLDFAQETLLVNDQLQAIYSVTIS